jgi:hypothetical protein
VLSAFLACDDPYQTAAMMTDALGWRLVFATPPDSDGKLACVALGDAEIMLSAADERFLPAAARGYRGAGVTIYVRLPADIAIGPVHARQPSLAWSPIRWRRGRGARTRSRPGSAAITS